MGSGLLLPIATIIFCTHLARYLWVAKLELCSEADQWLRKTTGCEGCYYRFLSESKGSE